MLISRLQLEVYTLQHSTIDLSIAKYTEHTWVNSTEGNGRKVIVVEYFRHKASVWQREIAVKSRLIFSKTESTNKLGLAIVGFIQN